MRFQLSLSKPFPCAHSRDLAQGGPRIQDNEGQAAPAPRPPPVMGPRPFAPPYLLPSWLLAWPAVVALARPPHSEEPRFHFGAPWRQKTIPPCKEKLMRISFFLGTSSKAWALIAPKTVHQTRKKTLCARAAGRAKSPGNAGRAHASHVGIRTRRWRRSGR